MFRNRFTCWTAPIVSVVSIVSVAISAGCKPEESKQPKTQTREGVITRVDPASRRLAMKVRNPQDPGKFLDQPIEGTVTETTDIWIDGRAARITDLKVNDNVQATGYPQGKGENANYVAQTIRVNRPV